MKLTLIPKKQLSNQSLEVLMVPVFEEQDKKKTLAEYLGEETLINRVALDFQAKFLATHLVYTPLHYQRILLVGLGVKKDCDTSRFRTAIQTGIRAIPPATKHVGLVLPDIPSRLTNLWLEVAGFALTFGQYQFSQYKHQSDKISSAIEQVSIAAKQPTSTAKQALAFGQVIGQATNQARDLANHPGNIATPKLLAAQALKTARKYKFKCKVLDQPKIVKEHLGLLAGVGKGSTVPPRFIILEYGNPKQNPVVLIGKGLTFDSGGISIKPQDRMEEMKYDMCGAAVVLGIFQAAAALHLRINLVGLIPAAENLPSGSAVKPGDVLTSHAKKTVEIINTDAEGRLVLADAISFALKYYQPKLIVDYASLTGAIVVALGDQITGYFSNTKHFQQAFAAAASAAGEKFWPMPLGKEEYKEQLDSTIADIKNMGEKRMADAITATLFLESFIGSTPWIHLDIAGTAWTTKLHPQAAVGASGWGVYATINFLRSLQA